MSPEFIIFDLETTGLKPRWHEIIEIGALRVSADLSKVLGQYERKIAPAHIETADPESLRVNGYQPKDWTQAIDLKKALVEFAGFSKGGLLAGYNAAVDWAFLSDAYNHAGIVLDIDYHIFDVFSVAWHHANTFSQPSSMRLRDLVLLYDLAPQPEPHAALTDARLTLELLRAVNQRMSLTGKYLAV